MIVPMIKYSFLVYHSEYGSFLEDIRSLGVVHVIEKKPGEIENEDLREKHALLQKYKSVITFLKKRNIENTDPKYDKDVDILELVTENQQDMELYQQKHASLVKDKSIIEPWGNFKWDDIKKLKENGITLRFYACSAKNIKPEWLENYYIEIINESGHNVYFVVLQKNDEPIDIDIEEIKLPATSLYDLNVELAETQKLIEITEKHFDNLASWYIETLENNEKELIESINFKSVVLNTVTEADNKLMILEGWVPKTKNTELVSFLDDKSVYYFQNEITPEDKVPVLLQNNKFARLFEPIGELFSLPAFKEIDLTPFFAPFYMLFFGFCLGDAGYGVLMVLASVIFRPKVKKIMKPILSLVFFLGLSTIIFGLIGGTCFGINLYETQLPVYAQLQQKFKAQNTDINQFLFNLSLIIGAIQIIFGMIIKGFNEIRQLGWKYSLSTFGWIIIILGVGSYVYMKKGGKVDAGFLDIYLYTVLGIGGVGAFLFNSPGKNIFLNVGAGIWNAYNVVTGILGDLLSYIRLFALALSSAILGFVFNSLAISMAPDNIILKIIVMTIILAIGHGINLFMSSLGSFVHPMRLTFVEFYKNAGFAGGGRKYSPFKK